MPKAQLTPAQQAHTIAIFAKGGFVPRRKGQRYARDFMGGEFYSQDGELHRDFSHPDAQVIAKVEFLGTFTSYDHHGGLADYRAFAITLPDGSRFAGYSRDRDQYVLCQMQSFLAQ